MLNLDPEQILMYFDLVVLGIILLCAIVGFIRGTYKSIYYFIVTLILIGGGWLLMNPVSKALLKVDLSFLNLSVEGIAVTTPKDFLLEYIAQSNPNELGWILGQNDSYMQAFIFGIVTVAFRLIWLIVVVILSFTIFRIISGIIWLIIRPKKKDKKKKKKTIGSRFGGMGIGTVKGICYSLLLVFLFAGTASVVDSVNLVMNEPQEEALIITGNTASLVELSYEDTSFSDSLSEYQDILDLLGGYRNTITGKVFGAVEFGKAGSIDEMMFDSIFSIKGKNGNIQLRRELAIIGKAFSSPAVQEVMNGEDFSIEKLLELDSKDIQDIFDTLSELKFIKVLVPVGVEFVIYSDVLGEEFDDIKEELKSNFKSIIDVDYAHDIQKVGYAFADLTELLEDQDLSNIDYFNLDSELVESILGHVGDLDLLEVVAPIAVSYVLNMEDVKSAFEEAGISIESLHLEDLTGKDWQDEIGTNLPQIYSKFKELGIKMVDTQINFDEVDVEKVDSLCKAIFASKILSNAVPVLSNYAIETFLPEEYADIIDTTIFEDVVWETELSSLLSAALVLVKTGVISENVDDVNSAIQSLSDADIQQLGTYVSKSVIITHHLNPIANMIFEQAGFKEGTLQGLDESKGETWNETEISSLFFAVKDIFSTGIINSNDPTSVLSSLTDEQIESLSTHLSESKFITKNLNPIVELILEETEFGKGSLQGLDESKDEKWTKLEISSLFYSIKDIFDTGIINSDDPTTTLSSLTDEQIEDLSTHLSGSRFITKNLNSIVDMILKETEFGEGTLQGLDESKGETWNKTEISSLFFAVKDIFSTGIINSDDPTTTLSSLTDEQIEDLSTHLSESKFVTKNLNSIVDMIFKETEFGEGTLQGLDESKGEKWTKPEISSLFYSIKDIFDTGIINSDDPTATLSSLTDEQIEDLSTHLSGSRFITKNLNPILDTVMKNTAVDFTLEGLDESLNETWSKHEIFSVFKSIQILMANKIISDSTSIETFSEIEDQVIEDLAHSIYGSIFMRKNMSQLLESAMKNVDIKLATLTKDEWTVTEIDAIFKSIKTISKESEEGEIKVESFLNLNSKDLDTVLQSKLMRDSIKNMLVDMSQPGEELEILKGVEENPSNNSYVWDDLITSTTLVTNQTNFEITKVQNAQKYFLYGDDIFLGSTSETSISKSDILQENASYTEYKAKALVESGELRHVFEAISCLKIKDVNQFDLDLKQVVTHEDQMLASYILTETVIDQIRQVAKDNPDIIIPEEYQEGGAGYWRDYLDHQVQKDGELKKLLHALDIALGISISETPVYVNTISADSIQLNQLIDHKDEVLSSDIMFATVVEKIKEQNGSLIIPSDYMSGDYTLWNHRTKDGEIVRGELYRLLDAAQYIVDFENNNSINIDVDHIYLNDIILHQDEILYSKILSATFANNITSLKDDGTLTIPEKYLNENFSSAEYNSWENEYNQGQATSYGELSRLLNSLNAALSIEQNPNMTIQEIDANHIHIHTIIENRSVILYSDIMTATIVNQIKNIENESLTIPNKYQNDDITPWENQYVNHSVSSKDAIVTEEGELSRLLNAIQIALHITEDSESDLNNINADDIQLYTIISQRQDILYSDIMTATFVNNIQKLDGDGLSIPDEYKNTNPNYMELWANEYESKEIISKEGELSKFLGSLETALELSNDSNMKIDQINADSVRLAAIIYQSDTILDSEVMTATFVNNIQKLDGDGLSIPDEYKNTNPNYMDKWKNERNQDGKLERRELSYFLTALGKAMNIQEDSQMHITDINATDIDLNSIMNEDDSTIVLRSMVLSETIKAEIVKNSKKDNSITLPNGYDFEDGPNYIEWNNEYDTNGVLLERHELSFLLAGLAYIVGGEEIKIDDMSHFDYKNIFGEHRDDILHSKIICETIIHELLKPNVLKVPEYDCYRLNLDDDRSAWLNQYETLKVQDKLEYKVTTYGELSFLLVSLEQLLGDNQSLLDTTNINYELIFDTEFNQIALQSKVLSETIIHVLTKEGNLVIIPKGYGLSDDEAESESYHRDHWYNQYDEHNTLIKENELAAMINAFNIILNDDQKRSLDNITFNNVINAAIPKILDENNRRTVLKSYVVCESIVSILGEQKALQDHIKQVSETSSKDFNNPNDRSVWYEISEKEDSIYVADRKVAEDRELWSILYAASRLLGGRNITEINEFSVDDLMEMDHLDITYDVSSAQITSSEIEKILNSYIMENVFAHLVINEENGILNSFVNAGFITSPTEPNWYRNDGTHDDQEYDLKTFLESVFLMKGYFNYKNLTVFNPTQLPNLFKTNEDIEKLGIAMVNSRIFKSSIANMYNRLFESIYKVALLTGASGRSWDEVKFVQDEYDHMSQKDAYNRFVEQFSEIIGVLKSVSLPSGKGF